ncbi:MAG TPA: OmpH family outer membrane protein [Terracidiphilus sp.]|nr:OmpH family outer membrane protein [Terracidiphilus sp.]
MKPWMGLAAVLFSGFAMSVAAQTGAASTGASAAGSAAAADLPTKIAIISFQAVVTQTNEFQRNFADLQKKYEPKRTELKTLNDEIETLQKQLQAQGATLSDAERENRARTISDKQKQLQREQEDDQNDFQQEMQDTFNGVASKVGNVLVAYAQQHGYTVVLDSGDQQVQMVLYHSPATDISQAILDAYNTKSGVPAPAAGPPSAPTPRPSAPKPPAQHQ